MPRGVKPLLVSYSGIRNTAGCTFLNPNRGPVTLTYGPTRIMDIDHDLVKIAGLIFITVYIVGEMYFKSRERLSWHETARLALEKGQPMPPTLRASDQRDQPPEGISFAEWRRARYEDRRNRDLKIGLVLLAIGATLHLMSESTPGQTAGAIIGGVGVALLVSLVFIGLLSRAPRAPDRR